MKIETKYDVGDKVFLMHKDLVTTAIITHIGVSDYQDNINYPIESHIGYVCTTPLGVLIDGKKFPQSKLFPSKEDLLKSL